MPVRPREGELIAAETSSRLSELLRIDFTALASAIGPSRFVVVVPEELSADDRLDVVASAHREWQRILLDLLVAGDANEGSVPLRGRFLAHVEPTRAAVQLELGIDDLTGGEGIGGDGEDRDGNPFLELRF